MNEVRLELNLDVNDRLTREELELIVRDLLRHAIGSTSYGIRVQSVRTIAGTPTLKRD
jgi:hypothetical protein